MGTQKQNSFNRTRVLHSGDHDPLLEIVDSLAVGVHSSQSTQVEKAEQDFSATKGDRGDSKSWRPDSSLVYEHSKAFMPSNASDANVRLQRLQQHRQTETKRHILPRSAPASTKLPANESRWSEIRAASRDSSVRPIAGNNGGDFGRSSKAIARAGTYHDPRSSNGQHALQPTAVARQRSTGNTGFRGAKMRRSVAGQLPVRCNGTTVGGLNAVLAGKCVEVELRNRAM